MAISSSTAATVRDFGNIDRFRRSAGLAAAIAWAALRMAGDVLAAEPPPPSVDGYRQFALQHDGDAAKGKAWFENEQRLGCVRCHSFDGHGQKVGPDLFSVGDQFSRRELIDAILTPSATLAVGYETTLIETRSGVEYTGILKQSTDAWVEVALADGTHPRVAKADIQSQSGSRVSLMPEGLQAGLSPQEFTDLIEYLVTLKQPVNSLLSTHGMPEHIPDAAHLAKLEPLLRMDLRFTNSGAHAQPPIQTGLVCVASVPGVPHLLMAADQAGVLWRIELSPDGARTGIYLDLSWEVFSGRGPNGLLGIAFHPKFETNRKYYLKHQAFENGAIVTYVVERIATADGHQDALRPSRKLLRIPAVAEHHNGGCLQFGPDGYLYIGMGDSAPNHDPQGHGQNLGMLLGKMLRIDVDHADGEMPYAVPADNPFVGRPGVRPEIWASGFREPWRFGFDSATGALWVADLGQERGDEVAVVQRGENHGWNVYQGFELFSAQYRSKDARYAQPVFATRRAQGTAIVGGYVYRGNTHSPLHGVYIFGDYGSKRIWGLTLENHELKTIHQLATAPQAITSFAQDSSGELYISGYQGMVYHLNLSEARLH